MTYFMPSAHLFFHQKLNKDCRKWRKLSKTLNTTVSEEWGCPG